MGVTKKKAYLKPEMTKFEMKMEASFLVGSKDIIDIIIPTDPTDPEEPTEIELSGLLVPPCTGDGNVTNMYINECREFRINLFQEDKCLLWDMIQAQGLPLKNKELLYIKRTAENIYRVSKENICN